jgi:hypothetical protein
MSLDKLLEEAERLVSFKNDILREADELGCDGEECEMHCALVDVAENIRLSASRIALVAIQPIKEEKGEG